MTAVRTRTDPEPGWRIQDDVIRLREWGTDRAYELPREPFAERVLGASAECTFQLDDRSGRVSRRHARLVRDGSLWSVQDLASKNGTWIDGVRRQASTLTPGTELGVGGLVLVAESDALAALHELLCRWIGWSADRRGDVDRALRAVRDATSGHCVLVLCGEGDLVPLAARIHREVLGERPFVVHDGTGALARAKGGTLCVAERSPDLDELARRLRAPGERVRVTACAHAIAQAAELAMRIGRAARIELPALAERRRELPRIIEAYAEDAAASLGQAVTALDKRDLPLVSALPFDGLADVEDTARRLVAIRALGVTEGAARLGITHGALSRWAKRRGLRT
jgi:hypothetical protein